LKKSQAKLLDNKIVQEAFELVANFTKAKFLADDF
jgi:hypothetical protein